MNKHKDVKSNQPAGALFTAAGAALVLLMSSMTAADQVTPVGPGPVTARSETAARPSYVTEGLNPEGGVKLISGKSTVLTTRTPYKRASVGSPDVADVNPIGPTSVLITAKKAGSTQLILWDDQDHSQVIDVTVELDLEAVKRQLRAAFPGLKIEATALNDTIALRGEVPSVKEAEQAVEMTSPYAKVHNFLEVSGGQQVMLQVRFAEVSKTAVRNLGVTFGGTDGVSSFATNGLGNGTVAFTGATPGLGTATAGAGGGLQLFGQGKFGAVAFDYFITALRQNGLVRVLAEPNLMATSGQQASFLAGGQIPVPVPQPGNGGSTIAIQYYPFGVQLNFTPQVLGNGRIRLHVAPEVSDLDFSDSVSVGGTSVPGFTDRKLETTVELADGQSFALAGLLNNKTSATINAIPFWGEIPILGKLFSSLQYTRSETELVVLVTPRLVAPLDPAQVPTLPGEKWRYPSDPQLFITNDLGGPQVQSPAAPADKKPAGPPPQFHGAYGFSPVGSGSATQVQ